MLPLNKWPTFVSTNIPLEDLPVYQFSTDKRWWDVKNLSLIFNSDLLSLITSIPLSITAVPDKAGWGRMRLANLQVSKVFSSLMGDLNVREGSSFHWIWKAEVSPRVGTFF